MQFSTLLSGLAASALLASANPLFEQRAACNADNCARAVTGAAHPTTNMADCSSFLAYTMTPSPIFVTKTVDSRPPIRGGPVVQNHAVTVTPTALPAYASAPCENAGSRYSSVCACAGVKTTMNTVDTPTHTVYVVRSTMAS